MKNRILIVGGTFDENGGRNSKIVSKIFEGALKEGDSIFNGGHIDEIQKILEMSKDYDIVVWWPNIDNRYEKIRNVKEINSHATLIISKRNDESKYGIKDLIVRQLEARANLMVVFEKTNDRIFMQDLDVLGYSWSEKTDDIQSFRKKLIERIYFLANTQREKSISSGFLNDQIDIIPDEYISIIQSYGKVFETLNAKIAQTERYLGNASLRTRCDLGFPSIREKNKIFVSRRNINKESMKKDEFVEVWLDETGVYYKGDNKPSVDSPIQLRLYEKYPQINYMIHSHCYIEDGIFTKIQYPCGCTTEADEIISTIKEKDLESSEIIKINLIGHGSLVMVKELKALENINYIERKVPEVRKLKINI